MGYAQTHDQIGNRALGDRLASLAGRERAALAAVTEKNAIVLPDGTDADVIAAAADDLEVAIHVFHVRAGRVRGERGWVADRADDQGLDELIESFCLMLYADAGTEGDDASATIPREVLLPVAARAGALRGLFGPGANLVGRRQRCQHLHRNVHLLLQLQEAVLPLFQRTLIITLF